MCLARDAKCSERIDSLTCSDEEEQHVTISVLHVPPSDDISSRVNVLSL